MAGLPTAQQIYDNWKAGIQAKSGNYKTGVQNGNDWAAAATAPDAVSARNAGLQRAISEGTIDAGIQRLGSANYKNITLAKSGNWLNAVNSPTTAQKAVSGFGKLLGFLQGAQNAISSTPRGGIDANLQRMVTHARSMHDQAQAAKGY